MQEDASQMECLIRKMRNTQGLACVGSPVPNYLCTRRLIIREVVVDGKVYVLIKCGCNYFCRKKGPCRHFYALVDREPTVEDFSPECYQSYEVFYGENEEYTRKCDVAINMMESHGGLLLQTTLEKFKKGMKEQHVDLG